LNHASSATRPGLNAFVLAARVYAFIGRLLLAATAVSLITMPLTQHVWTWDHFLRGGHDFEFGMLTILTTLSLVLLLAQLCKQSVGLLLAAFCRLLCGIGEHGPVCQGKSASTLRIDLLFAPHPSVTGFPLQI
jgi:hypothetical protein